MKRSTATRKSVPGFWIALGLGLVGIAGLVLVLLALTDGATPPPATEPAATQPPNSPPASATPLPSQIASPTASESPQATATQLVRPPTPTPATRPEVPDVAEAFTLEQAGGGTFTLSRQLEEGPVVLVFFERCG